METYKVEEGKLNKRELLQLSVAIEHMKQAMYSVSELVQTKDWGMTPEFCNKYPFVESFDELCYSVALWHMEIVGKQLDAEQAEQDYYNGTTEVK
jgi:hypothetical protein